MTRVSPPVVDADAVRAASRESVSAAYAAIRPVLPLGGVLALGLALRIVFWYGLVNVDPYAYADAAASIARWEPVFDSSLLGNLYYTQYLRLSLTAPAALGYLAFGPGGVQSTAFPIACSLGTGVVAYLLTMHVARDRAAGLIAALITVVFPENVINSTQFLPDTVMAFFAVLTVLLFWRGLEAEESGWRSRALLFAATGFTWALAFYGRQTAVGLAIPLAGLLVYYRRFDLQMLWGVAGAAVVGVAFSLLLLGLGGEPFEDVRTVIAESRNSQPGALGYTDIDFTYLRTFTKDAKFVPLTGLFLLGSALVALNWRRYSPAAHRRFVALAIVIAGLSFYFEFLMRLPGLYSWWKEPRYVLALVPLLAAVCGHGLAAWPRASREGQRLAAAGYVVALLGFMTAFNVASVRADHEFWDQNGVDLLPGDLATVLHGRPETTVFLWDDDLARYLSFHVGLDRTTFFERDAGRGYLQNRFDADQRSRVTPGSLVVTSRGQDHWSSPTAHADHWEHIWGNGAGTDVWRVPAEAPELPMQPAAADLGGDVTVRRAGTSTDVLLPQHHFAARFEVENRSQAMVTLRVGLACGGATRELREFRVTPGVSTVGSDMPLDAPAGAPQECGLAGAVNDGPWAPLGVALHAGSAVTVEPERDFTHDPDRERALGTGWFRVDQPFYSGGGSIVALESPKPLRFDVGPVAGDLWVDLGVYDYGDGGRNEVLVTVNGVERRVAWGEAGPARVRHAVAEFTGVPAGGDLRIAVVSKGQEGFTVDSVTVSSVPPPPAAEEAAPARAQERSGP